MVRVNLGIPTYRDQPPEFWLPFAAFCIDCAKYGIEIVEPLQVGAMMTDKARNNIVRRHLKTDVDWLYWIDDDNVNRAQSLRTLLDHEKKLIGGLYFNRGTFDPIAYTRNEQGLYSPIQNFMKGCIVQADAGGMNGLLTHRSVYEDIDDNYTCFNRRTGGVVAVHQDDIIGNPAHEQLESENDGKVVDGVYHEGVWGSDMDVPFFLLQNSRTEDIEFFEMAQRVGYEYWIDTSIEAPHLTTGEVTGEDYRRKRYENLVSR